MSSSSRRNKGWWQAPDGSWRHGPWFKVVINKTLRFFQTRRRPAALFVLYTRAGPAEERGGPPVTQGYGFGWVRHL